MPAPVPDLRPSLLLRPSSEEEEVYARSDAVDEDKDGEGDVLGCNKEERGESGGDAILADELLEPTEDPDRIEGELGGDERDGEELDAVLLRRPDVFSLPGDKRGRFSASLSPTCSTSRSDSASESA